MRISVLLFLLPLTVFAQWFPARVTFSDGSILNGEISPMGSKPLTLAPEGKVRSVFLKFSLKDILSITQETESATMRKPWMYKESGKADKIYFEGEYPFVEFKTVVLPVNGKVVRGHVISFPMRFRGQGSKKLFLNRQIKGRNGEKLSGLRYIVKIEFTAHKPEKPVMISGMVSGFGKIQQVRALDRERLVVHEAAVAAENTFRFLPLLPGKYDLVILTSSHVLTGFQGTAEVPELLLKNFKLADDFFRDRRILLFQGGKTLVYKRRAEFYDSEKIVKGGFLWHLEQWNWHQAGDEWKLDSRNILLRIKQFGNEPVRKILALKKLSGVSGGTLKIDHAVSSEELGPAY